MICFHVLVPYYYIYKWRDQHASNRNVGQRSLFTPQVQRLTSDAVKLLQQPVKDFDADLSGDPDRTVKMAVSVLLEL